MIPRLQIQQTYYPRAELTLICPWPATRPHYTIYLIYTVVTYNIGVRSVGVFAKNPKEREGSPAGHLASVWAVAIPGYTHTTV